MPDSLSQLSGRPLCTTMDCDGMATHMALVWTGEADEWFPYCWDCAETVSDETDPPVELVIEGEPDPFDPEELVRWAETYGHPEEWAKRAQNEAAKVERLGAERDRYREALEAVLQQPAAPIGAKAMHLIAREALGRDFGEDIHA